MSGVRVGSRLEQLLALRNRLNHEIAQERVKAVDHGDRRAVPMPEHVERPAEDERTSKQILADYGVSVRDVKEWAVSIGLLDQVRRGPVKDELIQAYAAARQEGAA